MQIIRGRFGIIYNNDSSNTPFTKCLLYAKLIKSMAFTHLTLNNQRYEITYRRYTPSTWQSQDLNPDWGSQLLI